MKQKEKVPATHMELVRDEYQTGSMSKFKLDFWLKKTANLKTDVVYNNVYYRYVAAKAMGVDTSVNDNNLELSDESVEQLLNKTSKPNGASLTADDIRQLYDGISLDLKLYDQFWATKKIFRFREDLVRKLGLTHLNKLDSYFVKLPFQNIIITLPDSVALDTGKSFQVNELYVSMEEKKGSKIFSVIGHNNTGNYTQNTMSIFAMDFALTDGDVLPQIQKHLSNKSAYGVIHFVLSALMYLNSSQPDINPLPITKSPMEKLLRKKGQGNSSVPHYSIGDNITIDRSWINNNILTVDDSEETVEDKQRRSLTPRWLVRGHWRSQRCGQNRSETKIIWIEPFEKGYDLSKDLMDKSYNVKFGKENS